MIPMDITYLGHSSFKIKTKSAVLVTDPYDPAMVGMKFPKIYADIVTISHAHADHNKTDLIKDPRKIIEGPGEYEVLGVSVIGFPSFHDDKKGEERGKNTIYVIEAEGLRIAHLGDLGHKLSESLVEDIGNIDILMIPIGGEFTINSSAAVEVVRSIEPKYVIPMHYKHAGLNLGTFGKLEEIYPFIKDLAWVVEETDKLSLKGILTEEHKVVKLKPTNG